MKLNNNIKILIIQHDYKSLQEFAIENELSYYMIRKLANNETNGIDIELLIKLCEIFNCGVGDLFYVDKAA